MFSNPNYFKMFKSPLRELLFLFICFCFSNSFSQELIYYPPNAYNFNTVTSRNSNNTISRENLSTDVIFNTLGTKMYTVGQGTDYISQYSLTIPFDIQTATKEKFLDVSSQEKAPESIIFNNDGTKLYVVGNEKDSIIQYNLTIAFDISTAVYNSSLNISATENILSGMTFNNNGTKLFLVGRGNNKIYEYSLSTAFLITTATLTTSFSILDKENSVSGIRFNSTGNKFFIIGFSSDAINEYSLSNNFDLNSTIVWQGGYNIASEDSSPHGITFNTDGTKMYTVGAEKNKVFSYNLSTPYDINSRTFTASTDVLTIENNATGISYNDDGSKLYITGRSLGNITEYDLATNYDITTANYVSSFSVTSEDTTPEAVRFNDTGTRMYVAGNTNNKIYTYELSSPYTISSASFLNDLNILPQDNKPSGIAFNNDGTKLYLTGKHNNNIYTYSLSSSYDITTASLIQTTSTSTIDNSINGLSFSNSGSKLFLIGSNKSNLYVFDLSTNFDVSTLSFDYKFPVATEEVTPNDLVLSKDGTSFSIIGTTSDKITQYNVAQSYYREISDNNGQINNDITLKIEIKGDTFQDLGTGDLSVGNSSQVQITGVPSGLTPNFSLSNNNKSVELTFSGTATAHQNSNGINNLIIDFKNSAFIGGNSSIIEKSANFSTHVGIDFLDNKRQLTYVGPNSYNVNNIEYTETNTLISEDTKPETFVFNTAGTKIFIAGKDANNIYEYNLSTPFDITTKSHISTQNLGYYTSTISSMYFNSLGTKLYLVSSTEAKVREFILRSPFDINTLYFSSELSIIAQETQPQAIAFNKTGDKMFIVGITQDTVYQYNLSKNFNLSTATYSGISKKVTYKSGQNILPSGISFNKSGSKLYISTTDGDDILQFTLSTPFDLTLAEYDNRYSFKGEDNDVRDIAFNHNGTSLYILGEQKNKLYQYNIISDFTEQTDNSGNIVSTNKMTVYLEGDTFKDNFIAGELSIDDNQVGITNSPSGLSPKITLDTSKTIASISFTGTASNHNDLDDIANLTLLFNSSAFNSNDNSTIENAINFGTGIGINYNFCPRDIRFHNNLWIGGSRGNGAPERIGDTDKGVYVNDDILLYTKSDCLCLEVTSNNKLTIPDNQEFRINTILKLNGEIRLVGNAQFIQKHEGGSNVHGSGKLLRDQTSKTTSIYDMSYWSPPVHNIGETTYTISNVLKDGTTPVSHTSSIVDINFVNGYDGEASSPIKIASTWIYSFLDGNSGGDWVRKKENGTFNPGEGFTLKSPRNSQNYTFVGTPNDGDITFNINAGNFSLLGNPYPSSLDLKLFFEDNSASVSTLYFWEAKSNAGNHRQKGYVGGYGVRNLATGVAAKTPIEGTGGVGNYSYTAPGRYAPVGQGFFIQSQNGGQIQFKNSQRTFRRIGENSYFFKNTHNEIPVLKVGLDYKDNQGFGLHRQLGISFKNGNTFKEELGYDSDMFDLGSTDMYFQFDGSKRKLVIAGIQEFDESLQIPIVVKIGTDQKIKIGIDKKEHFNNSHIFLIDKHLSKKYDISTTATSITLSEGIYKNRFYISFKQEALSNETISLDNDVSLFYDASNNTINIKTNNLKINKTAIYSILGKKIEHKKVNSHSFFVEPSNMPSFYLVRIETDKGIVTKKIFL